jgi:hypothetical protein
MIFVFNSVFSEEVSKFRYQGIPEDLNTKTVLFPDGVVAMNEHVRVSNSLDSSSQQGASAVMFVIDNSGSMVQNQCNDFDGARFTVTRALLDTLNRKNPNIMVGVVVYESWLLFRPGEDVVFAECPDIKGAYIKPIKLNGIYNNRTGFQILAKYLETQKAWMGYTELKYKNDEGSMTCINNAFTAAKHGLANCGLPKNRQFIIFLSDGIANDPGIYPDVNEYVKGTGTPTSFTVFLQWDVGPTPQQLLDMTNNIKVNGYSIANPQSDIWSVKTSFATLMSLLMKNVILKIVNTLIIFTPNNLTIGSTTVTNWDGTGFQFGKLFPLVGRQTDFGYTIKYSVMKDSITPNGDTIHIPMKDTIHVIKYTAEIRTGVPTPDKFNLTKWGRKMGFYYQNTQVDLLDETMKTVELRFTKYKVDTLYNYTGVKVDITSVKGGDKETYTLTDKPDYLSVTFPLVTAVAQKDDGALQHESIDSIVAVFRNPELPLDTLRTAVLFNGSVIFQVKSAVYFDRTADGHVDEMFIGITGNRLEKVVADIVKAITLPAIRQLDKETPTLVPGGIKFPVKENAVAICTYILPEDFVEVKDTVKLPEDCVLAPCKVVISDSVAPVIMAATLIDSVKPTGKDELIVDFSEDIKGGAAAKPFVFIKQGANTDFGGVLEPKTGSGKTWNWFITSLDGGNTIVENDSLRISEKSDVLIADNQTNAQINPANLKRPIKVKKVPDGIIISSAVYYDENADGKVDRINIRWSQKVGVIPAAQITGKLLLPGVRSFTVQNGTVLEDGIVLTAFEGSTTINTAVAPDENVSVTDTIVFSPLYRVVPSSAAVTDSVAPVILQEAVFKYSALKSLQNGQIVEEKTGQDSLFVTFSEGIKPIVKDQPFRFLRSSDGKKYDAVMQVLSQPPQSKDAIFWVKSIQGVENIVENDSLNIFEYQGSINVADLIGNNQSNPANIKRNIKVIKNIRWNLPELQFVLRATIAYPQQKYVINESNFTMTTWPEETRAAFTRVKNQDSGYMIISIAPHDQFRKNFTKYDSLEVKDLSIYDALGNVILSGGKMGFSPDNMQENPVRSRLLYFWDCGNRTGRRVGTGELVAFATVKRSFNDGKDRYTQVYKVRGFVGVKSK